MGLRNCDPKTREHFKNLLKQVNSYRNVTNLLQVSKTLVEQAIKWLPQIERHGRKHKITLSLKKINNSLCLEKLINFFKTN